MTNGSSLPNLRAPAEPAVKQEHLQWCSRWFSFAPWSTHPLFDAIEQGDATTVTSLLEADISIICLVSRRSKRSPWHVAAHLGHVNVLRSLVAAVLNSEQSVEKLNSSLRRLLSLTRTPEALLLSFLNKRSSSDSMTPLMLAALAGKVVAVEYLLSVGANPWVCMADGVTALHVAARHNQCHVSAKGRGCTALGHCLARLLPPAAAAEADAAAAAAAPVQPLLYTSFSASQVIHELLKQPPPFSRKASRTCSPTTKYVDATDLCGLTALHYAALEGHQEAVSTLLSHNANLVARTLQVHYTYHTMPPGVSALHIAAQNGNLPLVKTLLRTYFEASGEVMPSQTEAGDQQRRRARSQPDPRLILTRTARLAYHLAYAAHHTELLEWLDPSIPLMFLLSGSDDVQTSSQPDASGQGLLIGVPRLTMLAAKALHSQLLVQLDLAEKDLEAAAAEAERRKKLAEQAVASPIKPSGVSRLLLISTLGRRGNSPTAPSPSALPLSPDRTSSTPLALTLAPPPSTGASAPDAAPSPSTAPQATNQALQAPPGAATLEPAPSTGLWSVANRAAQLWPGRTASGAVPAERVSDTGRTALLAPARKPLARLSNPTRLLRRSSHTSSALITRSGLSRPRNGGPGAEGSAHGGLPGGVGGSLHGVKEGLLDRLARTARLRSRGTGPTPGELLRMGITIPTNTDNDHVALLHRHHSFLDLRPTLTLDHLVLHRPRAAAGEAGPAGAPRTVTCATVVSAGLRPLLSAALPSDLRTYTSLLPEAQPSPELSQPQLWQPHSACTTPTQHQGGRPGRFTTSPHDFMARQDSGSALGPGPSDAVLSGPTARPSYRNQLFHTQSSATQPTAPTLAALELEPSSRPSAPAPCPSPSPPPPKDAAASPSPRPPPPPAGNRAAEGALGLGLSPARQQLPLPPLGGRKGAGAAVRLPLPPTTSRPSPFSLAQAEACSASLPVSPVAPPPTSLTLSGRGTQPADPGNDPAVTPPPTAPGSGARAAVAPAPAAPPAPPSLVSSSDPNPSCSPPAVEGAGGPEVGGRVRGGRAPVMASPHKVTLPGALTPVPVTPAASSSAPGHTGSALLQDARQVASPSSGLGLPAGSRMRRLEDSLLEAAAPIRTSRKLLTVAAAAAAAAAGGGGAGSESGASCSQAPDQAVDPDLGSQGTASELHGLRAGLLPHTPLLPHTLVHSPSPPSPPPHQGDQAPQPTQPSPLAPPPNELAGQGVSEQEKLSSSSSASSTACLPSSLRHKSNQVAPEALAPPPAASPPAPPAALPAHPAGLVASQPPAAGPQGPPVPTMLAGSPTAQEASRSCSGSQAAVMTGAGAVGGGRGGCGGVASAGSRVEQSCGSATVSTTGRPSQSGASPSPAATGLGGGVTAAGGVKERGDAAAAGGAGGATADAKLRGGVTAQAAVAWPAVEQAGGAVAGGLGLGARLASGGVEDDQTCPVCLDEAPDIQLQRCGHSLCVSCARDLCKRHFLTPALCPYCRSLIAGFKAKAVL
ncbi:hypothetical protein QJQ45_001784 [Haematococcus lacustris]|nr:hypothetical protein QJQ45_001784 [Haematococcus lacustris]